MLIGCLPIMPNPTGPTAFPPMLVGAALPLFMVKDFSVVSKDEDC